MLTTGNLSVRRERLLQRLELEFDLKILKMKYEHADISEKSFYCVRDAATCILYMKNRVSITYLQMLFLEGYSNCEDGTLYTNAGRSVKAKFMQYVSDIIDAINNTILGDELNPAQFRFPFNEKMDNIGTIRISNPIARKLVDNIDILIDLIVTDMTRKQLWKRAMNNAIEAIIILRKKTNYTKEEILRFQEYYDMYAQDWLVL